MAVHMLEARHLLVCECRERKQLRDRQRALQASGRMPWIHVRAGEASFRAEPASAWIAGW